MFARDSHSEAILDAMEMAVLLTLQHPNVSTGSGLPSAGLETPALLAGD